MVWVWGGLRGSGRAGPLLGSTRALALPALPERVLAIPDSSQPSRLLAYSAPQLLLDRAIAPPLPTEDVSRLSLSKLHRDYSLRHKGGAAMGTLEEEE